MVDCVDQSWIQKDQTDRWEQVLHPEFANVAARPDQPDYDFIDLVC